MPQPNREKFRVYPRQRAIEQSRPVWPKGTIAGKDVSLLRAANKLLPFGPAGVDTIFRHVDKIVFAVKS